MEQCELLISLIPHEDQTKPHRQGAEQVEILIATNPGQEPGPINRIASGGELSRISLAIQVAIASTTVTPTLVFDEVDVGIGGRTADVVGQLLRELGETTQVICVTHLAQVASKSHQHLSAEKTVSRKKAQTSLKTLSNDEKTEEIARMLGGLAMTNTSLLYAKEMLQAVH